MSNDLFGKRLREAREKKNKSRKEVGEELNISPHTLSGYENGHRTPNIDLINRFADYYNVTTDWLLGRIDDNENGIYRVPISRLYQLFVIQKVINEMKNNKNIEISNELKTLIQFVGELDLSNILKERNIPDLNQYRLIKIITGPGGHPDEEELLGFTLHPNYFFNSDDEYYIYICGDNSMDQIKPEERILIKTVSETDLTKIQNKDIVLVEANGEYLLRRYYNVNGNTIFQADNPDFPPILFGNIIGVIESKLSNQDDEDTL
ncbi:XRE family transcriptional regulator [Brevibacillus laterosporus]|uniref:XRE family transcriptional regulator n=1 Tax=Brevibacillus laterosporus TaxID=1465 RepID=UPI003D1D8399